MRLGTDSAISSRPLCDHEGSWTFCPSCRSWHGLGWDPRSSFQKQTLGLRGVPGTIHQFNGAQFPQAHPSPADLSIFAHIRKSRAHEEGRIPMLQPRLLPTEGMFTQNAARKPSGPCAPLAGIHELSEDRRRARSGNSSCADEADSQLSARARCGAEAEPYEDMLRWVKPYQLQAVSRQGPFKRPGSKEWRSSELAAWSSR